MHRYGYENWCPGGYGLGLGCYSTLPKPYGDEHSQVGMGIISNRGYGDGCYNTLPKPYPLSSLILPEYENEEKYNNINTCWTNLFWSPAGPRSMILDNPSPGCNKETAHHLYQRPLKEINNLNTFNSMNKRLMCRN